MEAVQREGVGREGAGMAAKRKAAMVVRRVALMGAPMVACMMTVARVGMGREAVSMAVLRPAAMLVAMVARMAAPMVAPREAQMVGQTGWKQEEYMVWVRRA